MTVSGLERLDLCGRGQPEKAKDVRAGGMAGRGSGSHAGQGGVRRAVTRVFGTF